MGSRVPAIALEQYNFQADPVSTLFPLQDTMKRDSYYYTPAAKCCRDNSSGCPAFPSRSISVRTFGNHYKASTWPQGIFSPPFWR